MCWAHRIPPYVWKSPGRFCLPGLINPYQTFPLQKKYHTPEYLRTIQHLRLRTPFNSMMVRFRADIIRYTSQYYEDHKFIQTHPPIITSSDCEGAGEVFGLRTSDEKESSPSVQGNTSNLFFRSPKYLTVSSQLHLEALAQSVGKVWTLSPTFRAEKSDTARHLSEFYMLEAEMNAVDRLQALLSSVENLLRNIAYRLLNNKHSVAHELLAVRRHDENGQELDTAETAELLSRRWAAMAADGWPRITYTQAISILQNSGQNFEHKPVWGAGLQAEHERYLANTVGRAGGVGGPVFVTKYPRSLKPFYMLPSNTGLTMEELSSPDVTVDCFDLLVPDACEIAGGSMREHRLDYLLYSMRENGLVPPAPEDGSEATDFGNLGWYVDLRRWGSAPHGGYGIGFDRLLGYLAGVNNIREVVAFPRWAGRCDC